MMLFVRKHISVKWWSYSLKVEVTYMLFSKAMFLSSSLSTAADHWLDESSVTVPPSSPWREFMLDL